MDMPESSGISRGLSRWRLPLRAGRNNNICDGDGRGMMKHDDYPALDACPYEHEHAVMFSPVGKHMHLTVRSFDGEQVAGHLSVARHRLPIDIVA